MRVAEAAPQGLARGAHLQRLERGGLTVLVHLQIRARQHRRNHRLLPRLGWRNGRRRAWLRTIGRLYDSLLVLDRLYPSRAQAARPISTPYPYVCKPYMNRTYT